MGLWVTLRYRTGALVLLPLSLPLGRLTFAEVGPVPLSPVTMLVGLIGLAWAWRSFAGEERIRPSALQPPLALFLLVGVVDSMVQNLPLLSYSLVIPPQAHNLFVNLAAEVGLVGLLAFVAVLVVTSFKVLKIYRTGDARTRTLALGMAAGLFATLVHNLVDVTIYQGFVAILLFSYLGVLDAADGTNDSDGSDGA